MEIVSVWHIQGAIASVHLILLESCYCVAAAEFYCKDAFTHVYGVWVSSLV